MSNLNHVMTVSDEGIARVTVTGPADDMNDDVIVHMHLKTLNVRSYAYIKGSTYYNGTATKKIISRSYRYEPDTTHKR